MTLSIDRSSYGTATFANRYASFAIVFVISTKFHCRNQNPAKKKKSFTVVSLTLDRYAFSRLTRLLD